MLRFLGCLSLSMLIVVLLIKKVYVYLPRYVGLNACLFSVSVCDMPLSVCLSVSDCLFIFCLHASMSVDLSVYLPACLSVSGSLSAYLYACLPVPLSMCSSASVCQRICVFVYLCVCVSVCLCVRLYMFLKSIHKRFAAITDSFIMSRIFAQLFYFSRHYNGFDVYFMVNTIK